MPVQAIALYVHSKIPRWKMETVRMKYFTLWWLLCIKKLQEFFFFFNLASVVFVTFVCSLHSFEGSICNGTVWNFVQNDGTKNLNGHGAWQKSRFCSICWIWYVLMLALMTIPLVCITQCTQRFKASSNRCLLAILHLLYFFKHLFHKLNCDVLCFSAHSSLLLSLSFFPAKAMEIAICRTQRQMLKMC